VPGGADAFLLRVDDGKPQATGAMLFYRAAVSILRLLTMLKLLRKIFTKTSKKRPFVQKS
jgi:hypothetical protein